MKRETSLNPYAAAYIPLSKRGHTDARKHFELPENQLLGNEAVWFGHQPDYTWTQDPRQNTSQGYIENADSVNTSELSNLKDHISPQFYASSSYYPNEMTGKSNFDEEVGMAMEYLLTTFPGVSEESLNDVFLASNCDLDATIDMLSQLELYPVDTSQKLPDTLDIGDVPESETPGEIGSQKLKNVAGGTGASTSGSSKMASAN